MAKKISNNADKKLYSVNDSDAIKSYVGAYKILYENLQFISINDNCRKIVVSSAAPDDGKSNVSVNLAYTIANMGKKVCIVDTDLRKQCFYDFWGVDRDNVSSLTGALAGMNTLDEAIYDHPTCKNLSVIYAGDCPPNPTVVLKSESMQKAVEQLTSKFDYVIFDTPPVGIVPDAVYIAKLCDGVILVAKQNKTDGRKLKRAKAMFETEGVRVFGVVLTQYQRHNKRKNNGYSYRYGYSYGYGYGYGYGDGYGSYDYDTGGKTGKSISDEKKN